MIIVNHYSMATGKIQDLTFRRFCGIIYTEIRKPPMIFFIYRKLFCVDFKIAYETN